MSKRGVSIFELLITVSIISLLIILSVPGFKSFFSRIHINNGLRSITSALNTARYQAINKNKRVKLILIDRQLILKEKKGKNWEPFLCFDLGDEVSASMNSNPVFHPTGSVSPVCSIMVKNEKHHYKITLSIAGRIKIYNIKK